jgi:protein-L-isoaspartate(D-aspartate) O-methyltransferase
VKPNDKILEIGTGSGYQTAILVEMGARVYTIERQRELFIKAQELLGNLGYKPHFFFGDGFEGKPTYGPFDKILVTAAADNVPEKLLQQLKIGGIMVIPVGERYSQSMVKIIKDSENEYTRTTHGAFVFVPLLRGTEG